MRKVVILLLVALISLSASAQRRRRVKTPPPPTPEELAEQARLDRYEHKLQVIERVTFIDSVLLAKKEVMNVLSLGSENGSVHTYANFFGSIDRDTMDCALFRSQLGDKTIYARPGNDSILHLYASEMIEGKWTPPTLLPGLNDTVDQNYPFMLSDGVTLFYASKDESGLGGYDIYMTRWDADEQSFLKPENIGMPFNSEGNDYLYVVDEFNQLGWFVTDRGQSEDSVCIYCFIPNETRRIYNANELGRDTLVALANINSIRDTWTDVAAVSAARDRLDAVRNQARKTRQSDFYFVVNDRIVYTSFSQFRHKESIDLVVQWLAKTKDKDTVSKQLEAKRRQYLSADASVRAALQPEILALEQQYEQLIPAISLLEKEIRVYEQR